jgi:hypothetical protein
MFKPDRKGWEITEQAKGVAEVLMFEQDNDLDDEAQFDEAQFYEDEGGEGPFESLLRHAPEIEAGLVPGWSLDRSQAGALLWTTPSGRHYKSTLDGSSYAPYPR